MKVGLLRHAGERQKGNFREQLYVSVAPTFVISPRSTWAGDARRPQAIADQLSLGQLVVHGEQLQRDAAALLDRAAFDGEEIPSASASTEIRFASDEARAVFLREYVDMLTVLADEARGEDRRFLSRVVRRLPESGGAMNPDRFEATFVLSIDRGAAWKRLTEHPAESTGDERRYWLPGFDAAATVIEEKPEAQLRVTKDEQPCAGTEIVVTLTDNEAGTQITVVQSRFGDWLPAHYEMMAVGWRHIVADLHAYLATGAHAARHLRRVGRSRRRHDTGGRRNACQRRAGRNAGGRARAARRRSARRARGCARVDL